MPQRAYQITTPIHGPGESSVYYVDAPTSRKGASKARMEALRNAWDAGFEITFKDVKVKSLGVKDTPREIAQKRCDKFNAICLVGSLVKCYPVIPPNFADEHLVRVAAIRDPGAYVALSGEPVVATSGGVWAIDAVLPFDSAVKAEAIGEE